MNEAHAEAAALSTPPLCLVTSPFLLRPLLLQPTMERFWGMMSVLLALLLALRTWARSRAALQLEVLALRHQLQVLERTRRGGCGWRRRTGGSGPALAHLEWAANGARDRQA